MIATWRGLVAACAVAVLLALAAVGTRAPAPERVDRALVPGFAAEDVVGLAWTRGGAGEAAPAASRVERDPASATRWASVGAGPRAAADAQVVEAALAALRGGRWHRRGPVSAAGALEATLTVTRGGAPLVIGIGGAVAGTEQRWLTIGERAYLVDGWLARALAPAPLELRVRRPFAELAAARELRIALPEGAGGAPGPFVIAGSPRAMTAPAALLLDPRFAGALERALGELEILAEPREPVAPRGEGITAGGVTVRDAGPCPGSPGARAIDGTLGPGCVDGEAWQRALAVLGELARPPSHVVERRPIPLDLAALVLADGARLELVGRPRIDGRDADAAAVAALLAALATPAEPVALPAGAPVGTITATDRGGRSIALELRAPGIVARRGEPLGLRVGDAAWRRLTQPGAALRDLTPWREEPTTIAAIELGRVRYARGAVLGEWTRREARSGAADPSGAAGAASGSSGSSAAAGPAGASGSADRSGAPVAVDSSGAAALDRLAVALAAPQVVPRAAAAGPRPSTELTVTLHVQPIGGAAIRHTVQLGTANAAGCAAVLDGIPAALPRDVCVAARALAR